MNKHGKKLGSALFFLGLIALTFNYIAGLSDVNSLQLTALATMIAGTVLTVISIKKDSEY